MADSNEPTPDSEHMDSGALKPEQLSPAEVAAIVGSLAGFGLTRTIVSPAPEYLGGGNSQKAPNVELAISPLITAGSILPALSVGLRW